ncbi:hypothetical protein QQS21_009893 [Conoideocrella luteorostrata]|uniref:Uncharacterized protein n=1 Tax=Conoideocrella luteorostrata TaxID=1105319 RepID=A0AAJ0FXD8_9HYPO|nr:hypothetical protein QQS21_009893 [Conoideocrella luteorostrata]
MYASLTALLAYAALTMAAATDVSSAAIHAQAVCGDLGVMNIAPENLHADTAASDVRMCAEHPLGRNRSLDPAKGASLAPLENGDKTVLDNPLNSPDKRACYTKAPYGCSGGYCWKSCGNKGEWCWTAGAWGAGSWAKCKRFQDCGTGGINFGCGKEAPYDSRDELFCENWMLDVEIGGRNEREQEVFLVILD